jgi:hypothetical protein
LHVRQSSSPTAPASTQVKDKSHEHLQLILKKKAGVSTSLKLVSTMNQDQGNDNPASAPQVNVNNKSAARSYPGKGPSTTAAPGPQALGASSLIPVKRGPGRPKGSKNKEKAPITPNQLNIPSAKSGSKLTATTASKQSRDSGGQFAANPPISVAALEPKGFPQQPQQFKQNKVALKEPRNPPPTRASGVLNGPGLQPPRVPPASLPRPGSQLSHQLSSNPSAQLPTPHFVDISSKAGYDSDWVKEQVRLAIEQWLFIGREPPEAAIWAALNEARRNEDERLHTLNVENPQPSPWWTIARNYDENCLYLLQARLQNPQNHPGEYVTFDPKQVEAQRKKDPNWLIGIIGVRLVRKPERLQNNPEWVEQMVKDIRSAANRPVFDLPNHMINQSDYPAKQQALREAEAVVSVDVGASQNLPNAWSDRPNQDIWNFPDHLRYDIPPNVQGQILDNNSFKQYPDFQLPKAAMRPEDAVKELADAHRASRDSDVTKLREHLQQNLPPVLLRQVLSPPTPNPLRPIHLPSPDVLPFPDPRELAEAFTADQKEALLRLRQQLTNTLSPTELEEVLSSPGFHLPVPEPAKSSEPAKIKNNPQPGSWTSETDFHHFNAPFPYEDYDELDNQRQGGESLAAALYPSNPKEDDGHNGNGREPGNQDGTNIVNTITRDDGEITIGSIERDETITAIDSAIEQGRDDAELDNIFGDIMADIDRDEDYNEFISSVERRKNGMSSAEIDADAAAYFLNST